MPQKTLSARFRGYNFPILHGLVQVHEVHVDGFPRDFEVVLRVELQQRLGAKIEIFKSTQTTDRRAEPPIGLETHTGSSTRLVLRCKLSTRSDEIKLCDVPESNKVQTGKIRKCKPDFQQKHYLYHKLEERC